MTSSGAVQMGEAVARGLASLFGLRGGGLAAAAAAAPPRSVFEHGHINTVVWKTGSSGLALFRLGIAWLVSQTKRGCGASRV
jgi:hypothetical protein